MKILWASRHELDPDALTALKGIFVPEGIDLKDIKIESREILWPAGQWDCDEVVVNILGDFIDPVKCRAILAGVFPAQAVEAFRNSDFPGEIQVWSPVSVPETEPDVKKTRPFRFVRWARIV